MCKVTKSLYGLKQAPKQCHEKFDYVILEYGFTHNTADKCVYSKFIDDFGVIICLYVDDMLIISTNMNGINDICWTSSTYRHTKRISYGHRVQL